MAENRSQRIIVVGAGLGGAVMANYLARAGYELELHEKRGDIRTAQLVEGRSINLALSVRGIHALEEIGVAEEVMKKAVPMHGRMVHALDGSLAYQPYGTQGQAINSVSRGGLNRTLIEAAARLPNAKLFFNRRCIDVDLDNAVAHFEDSVTGERSTAEGDLIIGADGAFSAVRARMQRLDRFDYSQDYLEHGYKELTIPPGPGGEFLMEKNALHIWPRRSYMMIALPNADASYTVTCFWPFAGPHGFESLTTPAQVTAYFENHFPDAVPLMPTLANDYFENPTSSLVTVRCGPWFHRDKVVLLGDAAHAVVPFYGQGMNAAFEDCTVLNECLLKHRPDLGQAIRTYYRLRKENADALADLALENFIEMRDKVGDPAFLRKKQWEKRLHRWFPRKYVPLYEMVSFSRTPYAEAVNKARRQDEIIGTIRKIAVIAGLILAIVLAWLVMR